MRSRVREHPGHRPTRAGVAVGALLVRLGGVVTGAAGATPLRVAFVALTVVCRWPAVENALLRRDAAHVVTGRT